MRILTILILSFLFNNLIINKSNGQINMQDSQEHNALHKSTDRANWNEPTWDLKQSVSRCEDISLSAAREINCMVQLLSEGVSV